jgi:secernin
MIPLSCDTMVAVPGATRHGQTLFAKNSDRPREECQPLVQRARQNHAPGATVRTQFLELPQAPVTYRHVGSRPYWCWGYEHGFNEHQVVIGNEALQSRLPAYDEPKLVGMELIRLGLERGRTAAEAIEVMTSLIERYGQGKFKNDAGARTYDNGYIVADPREAYVLETAGHEWAVKRVSGAIGISNTRSLFDNYDRVSATAEPRAREQGWWAGGAGRFDFTRAYDTPPKPDGTPARVVLRGVRSCAVLGRHQGEIDVRTMMATLRDHSDGTNPDEAPPNVIPDAPSICMHYGRNVQDEARGQAYGNTAASLVADLCADGSGLPVYWCSFYSPCLGIFFPVFSEVELPAVLSAGGAEPSDESLWWLFRQVERAARGEDGALGSDAIAEVRRTWQPLQEEFLETAYAVAAQGQELIAAGREPEATHLLTGYVDASVRTVLATARTLRDRLAARTSSPATVPVAV